MKKIGIYVEGGVANIEDNSHNLNIIIIDFDNDEAEISKEEMRNYDAVILVEGGIAEIGYEKEGVYVEIKDYDLIGAEG